MSAIERYLETSKKEVSAKEADTPSDLKVPSYMMNFPFTLEVDNPNNTFMKALPPKDRKLDYEKAFTQFLGLYNFLAANSVVFILPSSYEKQDLPYVANLGAYLPHLKDETIILANMKSPPRQGEEPIGAAMFKMMKYNVFQPPLFFEGEAELKYLNEKNYVLGWGQRTSKELNVWFEKNFDMNILLLKETDKKCYHLDCVIFPLSKDKLITCVDLVDPKELRAIEKFTEIIPIDKDLGHAGTTNCVRCRNMVLCASEINELKETSPEYKTERNKIDFLNKTCYDEGLEPIIFNLSEFGKSGAALSCLVMNLNFVDVRKPSQKNNKDVK